MAKTVKAIRPEDLTYEMRKKLTLYHEDIMDRIDDAGEVAVKDLVAKTKVSAPVASGSYKKNIAWKRVEGRFAGTRFFWYVKGADCRLTHLLVKGHATRNGGRTKPDPFLQDALDTVLPEYEMQVRRALSERL